MVIKNIIIGWFRFFKKKTTEESKRRMEICKRCEYNKRNFCLSCGCYLPSKTLVETEKCLKNKW